MVRGTQFCPAIYGPRVTINKLKLLSSSIVKSAKKLDIYGFRRTARFATLAYDEIKFMSGNKHAFIKPVEFGIQLIDF